MGLFLRFTLVLCVLVFAFHPASARQISRPPIISAGPSTDTPWLPDLQKFGERVAIPVSHRIDILILGDGYTSRSRFEKDVRNWYADFSAITPWRQTTGLFRVRGYWTPSEAHATAAKQSYYRLPASRASVGDVYDAETRRKIWEAIDTVQANLALNADNHLTHTVLVMLIRTTNNFKPSGKCRLIVAPDGKRRVRVAFGNFTHHEFGHAMARLDDEYIGADKSTRKK